MSDLSLQQNSDSPFDSIRQVDSDGEFWSARDLMPLLGYEKWERFADAIDRAKAACQLASNPVREHFSPEVRKSNGRPKEDYRLSRYACYLTAMNGDPRKPEVAAAQSYFAAKTREAELMKGLPPVQQLKALPSAIEYVAAISTLSALPRNRMTALAEQLLTAEMAGIQNSQNLLPSAEPVKHYTAVMIRANQLGYSAKQIDGGVALGKFVKQAIEPDHKDWQGQYQVWQYEVNDKLDARIHSFFLTRAL
jgi:hypothetical protein